MLHCGIWCCKGSLGRSPRPSKPQPCPNALGPPAKSTSLGLIWSCQGETEPTPLQLHFRVETQTFKSHRASSCPNASSWARIGDANQPRSPEWALVFFWGHSNFSQYVGDFGWTLHFQDSRSLVEPVPQRALSIRECALNSRTRFDCPV